MKTYEVVVGYCGAGSGVQTQIEFVDAESKNAAKESVLDKLVVVPEHLISFVTVIEKG